MYTEGALLSESNRKVPLPKIVREIIREETRIMSTIETNHATISDSIKTTIIAKDKVLSVN